MERAGLADWARQVQALLQGAPSSAPEALKAAADAAGARLAPNPAREASPFQGAIDVEQADCIAKALDLAAAGAKVGLLVFCSAKRPGGGWLSGAHAQEESIANRSTWGARCEHPEFHQAKHGDSFYGDGALIHDGQILARQEGSWLEQPVPALMVGFAAPNLRALREHGVDPAAAPIRQRARQALERRCEKALAAFEQAGCEAVILGAAGCGVFEVDPQDAAQAWKAALSRRGGSIARAVFALGPRPSPEISSAFSGLAMAQAPNPKPSKP